MRETEQEWHELGNQILSRFLPDVLCGNFLSNCVNISQEPALSALTHFLRLNDREWAILVKEINPFNGCAMAKLIHTLGAAIDDKTELISAMSLGPHEILIRNGYLYQRSPYDLQIKYLHRYKETV